ncbi:peptidase u32 family [Anaeramoeba ignava]|uniref:Peptidase u32 family n=1 Tax=Anaeramoeba ignava TaxID=1746090 RepID=A0A9Q0L6Z6_ANAIG|nr:peptidase u32 family [Anaeramoeba ignava]
MNEILFFGSNKYPKLFKNELDSIRKPTQFKFENENENQIKEIVSSGFATIFLFKNGKAIEYLNENDSNEPQKIQIENIQKVTVDNSNEAILTKEGNVFAKGMNINPKNPNKFINLSELIEDTNDRIIEDIICTAGSVYLLTSNQNVYQNLSKDSDSFRFGFGSFKDFPVLLAPKLIDPNQNPLIDKNNELNDSETDKEKKKHIMVLMMKNVSKMFPGNTSTLIFLLNSNQELFEYKSGGFVDLGLTQSTEIKKPTKIQNIPKVK